jgi:hypothetical protein
MMRACSARNNSSPERIEPFEGFTDLGLGQAIDLPTRRAPCRDNNFRRPQKCTNLIDHSRVDLPGGKPGERLVSAYAPDQRLAHIVAVELVATARVCRRHRAPKADSRVGESLYHKALGDGAQSVTTAIFWLKTRAHWKETNVQEVTQTAPVRIELVPGEFQRSEL